VLVGNRDPIYAEGERYNDDQRQVWQRVGKTVTVRGQLMSLRITDFDIVCTWIRPELIYD
jgi:hypothetical protein